MFGFFQLSRYLGAFCVCGALCVPRLGLAQEATSGAELSESDPLDPAEEPAAQQTEDSADAAAMTHFHDARSLYDRGSYRDALIQFRASYALSRRAVLFYNYSLCYQRLREYSDAVNFLERYLLEVVNIPNRADLELRLRGLREAAEDAAQEEREEEGGVHPAVWASLSVAVAGGLMAAVAGPMALSERSRLDEEPCSQTSTCDASTLRRRARFTDVGIGVAGLGAVVGVVLLLVLKPSQEEGSVRVDPVLGVDGEGGHAGARLMGRF